MSHKLKVHIEDPKDHAETLCGRREKYLEKRKPTQHSIDNNAYLEVHGITCQFCINLFLYGTNRGDLRNVR